MKIRLSIVPWMLVAVTPVASVTEDEGCDFVGARFAPAVSRCESGNCTGIVRRENGRYGLATAAVLRDAVPCSVAALHTDEFLRQPAMSRRGLKRPRPGEAADQLSDLLDGELHALLKFFYLTGNLNETEAKRVFSLVDTWTVRAARDDLNEWRSHTVTGAETALANTLRLAGSAARTWLWKPLKEDGAIAAVMGFYFDLAAVTFRHALDDGALYRFGGFVTQYCLPIHRCLGVRDCTQTTVDPIGLPQDTSSGLRTVYSLQNRPASPSTLMRHVGLFLSSRLESNTSADALILDAMEQRCSVGFAAWLRVFLSPASVPVPLKLKIGNSWLDFCRSRASRSDLHAARRALLTSVNAEILTEPPAGGAPSWLASLSCIHRGHLFPDKDESQTRAVATRILNEVLYSDLVKREGAVIHIREPVEENAFIIGRGIGIAALGGADLSHLPFSRELMTLIHPRLRRSIASLDDYSAAVALSGISPASQEAVASLAAGVAAAFGPGGAEIITESDWYPTEGLKTVTTRLMPRG